MIKKFYSRKNARIFADSVGSVVENEPSGSTYKYRVVSKQKLSSVIKVPEKISFEKFISQPPKVDEKLFNLWLYKIKAKYSNYDAKAL